MSDKAEARIEAELRGSPAQDGEKTEDVHIPASGLDLDEVEEVGYVRDVIEDGDDEYRVYASVSGKTFASSSSLGGSR